MGDYDFGTIIADKYCLEEQIGEGGFGAVWRANQMDLDRPVAIKLLRTTGPYARRAADRLVTEARLAAAVQHRNVVSILDVGLTEDGTPFLVMEFLQGESLADRIDRKPMAVADIVKAMDGALRGLAAVHAASIVHSDLKPENIFLVHDADGWFSKLLDFGISKGDPSVATDPRRASVITRERAVGTPQYMSPEQARGLPHVDGRSDLFAIGIVLYEALTGVLPFDADDPLEVLIRVTKHDPQPLIELRPELGEAMSAVLTKALAKDPKQRFEDARTMRVALQEAFEALEGREVEGRPRPIRRASTRLRPMSTPPPGPLPGVARLRDEQPTTEAPLVPASGAAPRPSKRAALVLGVAGALLAVAIAGAAALWSSASAEGEAHASPREPRPAAPSAPPPSVASTPAPSPGAPPAAPEPSTLEPETPEPATLEPATLEPAAVNPRAAARATREPASAPARGGAARPPAEPASEPAPSDPTPAGGRRGVFTSPDF